MKPIQAENISGYWIMNGTFRCDIEVLHLLNKCNFRIASLLHSDWWSRCDDVLGMISSILEIKDPVIKNLEKEKISL